MKKVSLYSLTALAALCFTAPAHANVIWPAAFIAGFIYNTWFLIFISIIIEAHFFKMYIDDISYGKALLMSCVGNAASTLVGTIATTIGMIGWHIVTDPLIGAGTFAHENWIATIILMCLGSAAIELATLALIFRYPIKQLWTPVLMGNIATYVLTWAYYMIYIPKELYPGFRFSK